MFLVPTPFSKKDFINEENLVSSRASLALVFKWIKAWALTRHDDPSFGAAWDSYKVLDLYKTKAPSKLIILSMFL